MPGLTPVDPAGPACVDCGREAAGPCALCGAPLCGECARLVPGLSRPLAVCRRCAATRRPRAGRRLVIFLMGLALVLAALAALAWWLRG